MATENQVATAKALIGWPYKDTFPIQQALTAGRQSENKQEREGNRTLATYADTVIELAIKTIGLKMNISRGAMRFKVEVPHLVPKLTFQVELQHDAIIMAKSKKQCAKLARQYGIDRLVKPSEQQQHEPPSPRVLKNAMYALVGAVFLQELDWRQTIATMKNIGLLCLNSESFDPHDLESDSASNSIIGATAGYAWPSGPSSLAQNSASLASCSESAEIHRFDSDTMPTTSRTFVSYTPPSGTGSLADANTGEFPDRALDDLIPNTDAGWSDDGWMDLVMIPPGWDSNTGEFPDRTLADLLPNTDAGWSDGEWMDLVMIPPGCDSNEPPSSISYLPQDVGLIAGNTPSSQAQGQSFHLKTKPPRIEKRRANRTAQKTIHGNPEEIQGNIAFLRPLLTIEDSQVTEYAVALCRIEERHRRTLMKLIPCIATSTVVLSLKEVVLNARRYWNQVPQVCKSAVSIGKARSLEQRCDDIKALEVCIAHFQIAVRLHTYKLYEEHSAGFEAIRTATSDPFVIETGVRSKQRGRGNPQFIETAAMTKVLASHCQAQSLPADEAGVTLQKKSLSEAEKLRQTGKRLDMMVGRFGIGILAVVGIELERCRIGNISERALDQFLNAVERFEGAQIREFSAAAEPVVRFLLADCEGNSKFLFEDIDDDLIKKIPRCSPSLVNTFASIG